MQKPLRIYLGDLTYDTITLSTEVFPLNVGFVASYCLARFPGRVEVRLFKYIEDLEKTLETDPPDVLGLSNYPWNHRIGLALFRMFHAHRPDGITVMGGPNFPHEPALQARFMAECPEVDVYVHLDGEVGFANAVARVLDAPGDRAGILSAPIAGCVSRGPDGVLRSGAPVPRISQLDEIPSPYLTGLLDPFFDGRLNPMLQTNRGCPFTCTFCHDGTTLVTKVNRFSLERVTAEIRYIAERVPRNTQALFISDLNFGMIPRDLEICDVLAEVQRTHGYPYYIDATTGKNAKARVIEAVRRLNGALRLSMSVQSMDEDVLANIRRDNISVDDMLALRPAIKQASLTTTAEVILGLPGESYASHVKTLGDLVRAGLDHVVPYTLMLLNGTELNSPEQREKWGYRTKFRVLPRDFVALRTGEKVIEVEEVVVTSRDLSFEDYQDLRMLALILHVTTLGIIYDPVLKLLRESGVDVFELFHRALKHRDDAPPALRATFESFRRHTLEELWDSAEAIQAHYQDDREYGKLLRGEAGVNVLQHHRALVMAGQMDEWTEYIAGIAREMLREAGLLDAAGEREFTDVAAYCRGLGTNIMGKDRLDVRPVARFAHDVPAWLADAGGRRLREFVVAAPLELRFEIELEQHRRVQDVIELFGDTPVGRSKAAIRLPAQAFWRQPVRYDKKEER